MGKNNIRFLYIDMLKAFGVFLMILCHAGLKNKFTQWAYAFHMPLFFIASGILLNVSTEDFTSFIKKKAKQLLIPYLCFALILCFGTHAYLDWIYIFYGSRNALAESSSFTPLWFLPCFFCSTIIAQFAYRACRGKIKFFCYLLFLLGAADFS